MASFVKEAKQEKPSTTPRSVHSRGPGLTATNPPRALPVSGTCRHFATLCLVSLILRVRDAPLGGEEVRGKLLKFQFVIVRAFLCDNLSSKESLIKEY